MSRNVLCFIAVLLAAQAAHAIPTINGGQAYIDECRANGVPKPPDWPSSDWKKSGNLDRPLNPHDPNSPRTFISPTLFAEVYYFDSRTKPSEPPGICIGLPRFVESARNVPTDQIWLFGIICQSKKTGAACFWDNTKDKTPMDGVRNGTRFDIGRFEDVPIFSMTGKSFSGGADLFGATGNVCTECHAGENAFIIHPEVSPIDPSPLALGEDLLKPDQWYQPLVDPNWPDNPGPGDQLTNVPSEEKCTLCHGPGGHRFPQLSTELGGYCASLAALGELESAIAYTMPAFQILDDPTRTFVPAAKDARYNGHIKALRDACKSAPPPSVDQIMNMMD